jgi:hypothetical protein
MAVLSQTYGSSTKLTVERSKKRSANRANRTLMAERANGILLDTSVVVNLVE